MRKITWLAIGASLAAAGPIAPGGEATLAIGAGEQSHRALLSDWDRRLRHDDAVASLRVAKARGITFRVEAGARRDTVVRATRLGWLAPGGGGEGTSSFSPVGAFRIGYQTPWGGFDGGFAVARELAFPAVPSLSAWAAVVPGVYVFGALFDDPALHLSPPFRAGAGFVHPRVRARLSTGVDVDPTKSIAAEVDVALGGPWWIGAAGRLAPDWSGFARVTYAFGL